MRRRRTQLLVELLEDRLAPATFAVPWPDPQHLTLSFAPDGTQVVGGSPSQLFSLLNAQFQTLAAQDPTTAWQREILRAFQTWAVQANINIGVVTDDGQQDFGAAGPPQGDLHFGDIRVGSYTLAPDVVAVSMPFDVTAGTWSGDVRLNVPNYTFGIGGTGDQYDLFTVMLHEAGHVFGLPHSTDPASGSVMLEDYSGPRSGLAAVDIAALQALYGARQPDAYEPSDGFSQAPHLMLDDRIEADLTTLQDVDVYQLVTTGNSNSATIHLRTAGLSLLEPRINVYEVAGPKSQPVLIQSASSTELLGSDLTLHLDQLKAKSTYFIEVESATADVFGIGSYRLEVDSDTTTGNGNNGSVGANGPQNGGNPGNDIFATATNLQPKIFRVDDRFNYLVSASLSDAADVDVYRIHTPNARDGASTMTVLAWSTQPEGLHPAVRVYDNTRNEVAAEVLVNESGVFTVQIPDVEANANYYIEVAAAHAGDAHDAGAYALAVDFNPRGVDLPTLVDQHLVDATQPDSGTLHVAESQLFHFVLAADSSTAAAGTVTMTVTGPEGAVTTLTVAAGDSQSATLFLLPGNYAFDVTCDTDTEPLTYTLRGLGLSDPIGPHLQDPTLNPVTSFPTAPTADGAYWWEQGFYAFLAILTPPANPGSTGGTTGPATDSSGVPAEPTGGTSSGSVSPTVSSPPPSASGSVNTTTAGSSDPAPPPVVTVNPTPSPPPTASTSPGSAGSSLSPPTLPNGSGAGSIPGSAGGSASGSSPSGSPSSSSPAPSSPLSSLPSAGGGSAPNPAPGSTPSGTEGWTSVPSSGSSGGSSSGSKSAAAPASGSSLLAGTRSGDGSSDGAVGGAGGAGSGGTSAGGNATGTSAAASSSGGTNLAGIGTGGAGGWNSSGGGSNQRPDGSRGEPSAPGTLSDRPTPPSGRADGLVGGSDAPAGDPRATEPSREAREETARLDWLFQDLQRLNETAVISARQQAAEQEFASLLTSVLGWRGTANSRSLMDSTVPTTPDNDAALPDAPLPASIYRSDARRRVGEATSDPAASMRMCEGSTSSFTNLLPTVHHRTLLILVFVGGLVIGAGLYPALRPARRGRLSSLLSTRNDSPEQFCHDPGT